MYLSVYMKQYALTSSRYLFNSQHFHVNFRDPLLVRQTFAFRMVNSLLAMSIFAVSRANTPIPQRTVHRT
jgi:hypothetical protein